MKDNKRKTPQYDSIFARLEIGDAKERMHNSLIWVAIYTVVTIGAFVLWENSKFAHLGIGEFISAYGAFIALLFVSIVAISVFRYIFRKQTKDWYVCTLSEMLIALLLSYLGTALLLIIPTGLIVIVIETIEPLHLWLTAPVESFLKYRGYKLVCSIAVFVPYIFLVVRYFKEKKRLPYLIELQTYYENEEIVRRNEKEKSKEIAQKASWEKLKEERREAEKRKREKTNSNIKIDKNN